MKFPSSPYLIAVILHVAGLGSLAFYSMPGKPSKEGTGNQASYNPETGASLYSPSAPPYSTGALEQRIAASLESAAKLTPPERLNAASAYAQQLEKISSVSSMKEIGTYLSATVAVKLREGVYDPGKEHEFDHSSSMPVGARQTADGTYVFVFRDAKNNSYEAPAAPGDEMAARAFALLDRSDVLREFKTSVLLPILNDRLERR
jgi:hypothetical protein